MYELFGGSGDSVIEWQRLALYDDERALDAMEDFARLFADGRARGALRSPHRLELWKDDRLVRDTGIRHDRRSLAPGATYFSVWADGVNADGLREWSHGIRLGYFDDEAAAVDWMLKVAEFYTRQSLRNGLTRSPAAFRVYDNPLRNHKVAEKVVKNTATEERNDMYEYEQLTLF